MPHYPPELALVLQQLADHQAAMVREQRELRALISAVVRTPMLEGDQGALLIAVSLAMDDRSFTAAELMLFALGGSPAAKVLAAHVTGISVKALGKRLAGVAGKATADGLLLERQGSSSEGVIWRVSKSQTHSHRVR